MGDAGWLERLYDRELTPELDAPELWILQKTALEDNRLVDKELAAKRRRLKALRLERRQKREREIKAARAKEKTWRDKNPLKLKAAAKARANHKMRERRRAFVEEFKLGKPCLDCGVEYPPPVMEFDHVRGEKEFGLAEACTRNVKMSVLRTEVEKCDLVCANCHRIRHIER